MRLEDITVALRPRSGWDAIDLGSRMHQQWWRSLLGPWLIFVLPPMLAVVIVLHDQLFWCMLALWWLKPVYDRFALHVFSRRLLGNHPRLRGSLRRMAGLYFVHPVKSLTVYRFDPARAFNLPVWQLEGLKGRARRERSRILQRRSYNPAVNLTALSLVFEAAVFMAVIGLFHMLLPTSEQLLGARAQNGPLPSGWISTLVLTAQILTYSLVEPIYVACGFSLYINRRTILEGWDIELAFQRMAERLKRSFAQSPLAVSVLALCLSAPALVPSPALAQEASTAFDESITPQRAQRLIDGVLADPVFGERKQVEGWYPIEANTQGNRDAAWWESLAPLFEFIARLTGLVSQALPWLLLAMTVFFLIILAVRYGPSLPRRGQRSTSRADGPTTLFGLSLDPQSLPADIAGNAASLARAEQPREALSLLYRAALSQLINRYQLALKPSATEGDCLRLARRAVDTVPPSTLAFFESLTQAWRLTAYGARAPRTDDILDLCNAWSAHFTERR